MSDQDFTIAQLLHAVERLEAVRTAAEKLRGNLTYGNCISAHYFYASVCAVSDYDDAVRAALTDRSPA